MKAKRYYRQKDTPRIQRIKIYNEYIQAEVGYMLKRA